MRRRSIRGRRESGELRWGEGNGFGIRVNFKARVESESTAIE